MTKIQRIFQLAVRLKSLIRRKGKHQKIKKKHPLRKGNVQVVEGETAQMMKGTAPVGSIRTIQIIQTMKGVAVGTEVGTAGPTVVLQIGVVGPGIAREDEAVAGQITIDTGAPTEAGVTQGHQDIQGHEVGATQEVEVELTQGATLGVEVGPGQGTDIGPEAEAEVDLLQVHDPFSGLQSQSQLNLM